MSTISPNMNLTIPSVGITLGPAYASQINSTLNIIDTHDHSSGSGVRITPSGLNINSELPINNNNIISIRSARFQSQGSLLALTTDLNCLYVSGVDLYYNDGNGNQVRVTDSGGIAGTPGSIANLVSPASASYVSGSQTFVWQSAANTAANLDAGSIRLREILAGSNAVTLSVVSPLTSNYTLTLPVPPATTQTFLAIDASGNITAPAYDANTLSVTPSLIKAIPTGLVDNISTQEVANKIAVKNAYQPLQFAALGKFGNVIASYPETEVGGIELLPFNYSIESIFVSLQTAATSDIVEFDILRNGTTILSTKGAFAAGVSGNTDSGSVFAPTAGITKPVVSLPNLSAGDRITMSITDGGLGAENLIVKVFIKQR
jgi:hypothetical protein